MNDSSSEKQILLSVIVPTRNCAHQIYDALSSIFSNNVPDEIFEVLVVDYNSSDSTLKIASKFPVRILKCKRKGIGVARNFGIVNSKGKILCFTDADCVVEKEWLAKILKFFKDNPGVDGVGGPTLAYPQPCNKIQKFAGEIFVEDQGFPKERRNVQFGKFEGSLFGTNSAYRKEALVSVGGFTPGGNCIELSWRLVSNGKVLVFDPDLKVYHKLPWSIKGVVREQFRWGVQMAGLQIRHKVFRARNVLFKGYFLVRSLLSIFNLKNFTKNMLRFIQLLAFLLGYIFGMRIIDYL